VECCRHAGFGDRERAREILSGIEWEQDWIIRFQKQANGMLVSAGIVDLTHDLMPEAFWNPDFLGLARGS
jgi:hypothetical protein